MMPISNALLLDRELAAGEKTYPLHCMFCEDCGFTQLNHEFSSDNFFEENYVYYSSFSSSWLMHSENYAKEIISEYSLAENSHVLEIASNDGYLLQYFKNRGMQVLGIEPSRKVAEVAKDVKKIDTIVDFFTEELALDLEKKNYQPDLIIANNVLAHVPNINDFIAGFSRLLKDNAFATFEFPHLMNLIKFSQCATIYHEHYSYLTVGPLIPIFKRFGLKIFRVEKLTTHGGSLRVYAAQDSSDYIEDVSVKNILIEEKVYDPREPGVTKSFQESVEAISLDLHNEILKNHLLGRRLAGYGAAAKGNTLLNYCGINMNHLTMIADANPHKQNKLSPGSSIPIVSLNQLVEFKPEVLLILPWNISQEIVRLLKDMGLNETKFLLAVPKVTYL